MGTSHPYNRSPSLQQLLHSAQRGRGESTLECLGGRFYLTKTIIGFGYVPPDALSRCWQTLPPKGIAQCWSVQSAQFLRDRWLSVVNTDSQIKIFLSLC